MVSREPESYPSVNTARNTNPPLAGNVSASAISAPAAVSACAAGTVTLSSGANAPASRARQRTVNKSPASCAFAPSASAQRTFSFTCALSSLGVRATSSAVTAGR